MLIESVPNRQKWWLIIFQNMMGHGLCAVILTMCRFLILIVLLKEIWRTLSSKREKDLAPRTRISFLFSELITRSLIQKLKSTLIKPFAKNSPIIIRW